MTEVPGLDVGGLSDWLRRAHPELAADTLDVQVIAGGKSNLTYRVDGPRIPLVLRRPPLGHVLSSAHDMRREHRVISALQGRGAGSVPSTSWTTPRRGGSPARLLRDGVRRRCRPRASEAERAYTGAGLRAVSVELAETPGRPARCRPGIVGWPTSAAATGSSTASCDLARQCEASRSRELPRSTPCRTASPIACPHRALGIVHGDYRLDNALVAGSGETARIAAISTGRCRRSAIPYMDLGMFGLYWESAHSRARAGALPSAIDPAAGYPSFDELVEAYAARAGIAVPDLSWYGAFAAYKLGVIAEGIHFRFSHGETVGAGFDRIGALVEPIAAEGLRQLGAGRH